MLGMFARKPKPKAEEEKTATVTPEESGE
jgi:hypothetical protein